MRKGLLETVITGASTRTSHAQVVNELGKAIIAGDFPIGAILPGDAELAQRFKVSRTVLREAMKTLAAKGLIVPRARIGTRVTPKTQWNLFDGDILTWYFAVGVSQEFLLDLSEVRLAFEPHAAALAARHATDADISQMMRLAVADLKFHLCLLEVSRNPFLRTVGSLIEAALVGVFKLSSAAADHGKIEDIATTHIRIVEEIRRRDENGARRAMEHVIQVGRGRVVDALEEKAREAGSLA